MFVVGNPIQNCVASPTVIWESFWISYVSSELLLRCYYLLQVPLSDHLLCWDVDEEDPLGQELIGKYVIRNVCCVWDTLWVFLYYFKFIYPSQPLTLHVFDLEGFDLLPILNINDVKFVRAVTSVQNVLVKLFVELVGETPALGEAVPLWHCLGLPFRSDVSFSISSLFGQIPHNYLIFFIGQLVYLVLV